MATGIYDRDPETETDPENDACCGNCRWFHEITDGVGICGRDVLREARVVPDFAGRLAYSPDGAYEIGTWADGVCDEWEEYRDE